MLSSILLTTLCAVTALAQTTPPAPPTLTYLYTLNCTLGQSLPIGTGPRGSRTVIPITGGAFSGPKLNGISKPKPQTKALPSHNMWQVKYST